MAASSEAAAGAAPAKGKRRLGLLLGGAGLVVLLAGGGGAAYFLGLFGGAGAAASHGDAGAHAADAHDAEGHDAPAAAPTVAFVDMPDLIVNLQAAGPRLRYLKLRLSLEVADAAAADAVVRLMPRVLDSFQLYLRALTLEEVEGAAGMQRLKEELTARVSLAVDPVPVQAVLLKEMLVQ